MSEVGILYSSSQKAATYGWARYLDLLWESCKAEVNAQGFNSNEEKHFPRLQPPSVSRNKAPSTKIYTTSKIEARHHTFKGATSVESEEYKHTRNTIKPQHTIFERTPVEGSWRDRSDIPSTNTEKSEVNNGSSNTVANSSFPAVSRTNTLFTNSLRVPDEVSWRNRLPQRGTYSSAVKSGSRVLHATTESGCRLHRILQQPYSSTSSQFQAFLKSTSPIRPIGSERNIHALPIEAKPFTPASHRNTAGISSSEVRKRLLWNQPPKIISQQEGQRRSSATVMPTYPQYDQGNDYSKIKTPFSGSTPVHIKAAWALTQMYLAKMYEKDDSIVTIFNVYQRFVYDMQTKPETFQMFLQTVAHIYDQFNRRVKVDICHLIRYLPDRIWHTNFAIADDNIFLVIKHYYQKYPVRL